MDSALPGILLLLVGAFLYFIPAVVASMREHQNAGAIFALNLFLGWSVLGWVVALVWALADDGGAKAKPAAIKSTPTTGSNKFCSSCGNALEKGKKFCAKCGAEAKP